MFCNNCGAQNPDGANNCSNCGASLNNVQQPAQPAAPVQPVAPVQPQKPKNNKGLIIGIVAGVVALIAIVAVVLVFVLGGDKDKDEKDDSGTTKAAVTQDAGDKNKDKNDNKDEKEPSTNPPVQTPTSVWGSPVTISTSAGEITFPCSTTLNINGKQVTFPCKLSDFLSASGLSLDEDDVDLTIAPRNDDDYLSGYTWVTAIGTGVELDLDVSNYSGDTEIPVTEGIVDGVCVYYDYDDELTNSAVSIVSNIKLGLSQDEVVAILGMPDDKVSDSESSSLVYEKQVNGEYAAIIEFEFYPTDESTDDQILTDIEIEYYYSQI